MNVFSTPPFPVETGSSAELEQFMMDFDWQNGDKLINATTADFPQSAMEMIAAPEWENPNLEAFEAAGGKLIIYHGSADPIFSLNNIEDWHNKLLANNADAANVERFYAVPGMPHGAGRNAADDFDALDALIKWVETSEAPDALEAKFRADNPEAGENAGATRPLCPYPTVAIYKGGEENLASSFSCE